MIRFKIATRTTVCIITSAMLLLLGCSNSKKIENQVSENSPVKSANEKVSLPEIVTVSTDEKGFASLSDVAHNSKVIVVATISGDGGSDSLLNLFAKEKTTPPGNLENPIITPYKAKVKEVLKGDIKEGDILKIYQEGGIYQNKEYRYPGIKKLENSKEYLLFLNPTFYLPNYFVSLTTTIGIYQTDNNQIIFSDNNDNGNIDFAKKHLFDDDTNLDRIKSKIKKYGM